MKAMNHRVLRGGEVASNLYEKGFDLGVHCVLRGREFAP